MSTFEEKEQERVGGEGDNKIDRRSVPEMILRKCHFSVNVILFAFTVTLFIDVFYGWTPLKDIPRFRYTDPVLLLSMVWGLMQVAIVSFGKERNVFCLFL